jgi:hypothetical protein
LMTFNDSIEPFHITCRIIVKVRRDVCAFAVPRETEPHERVRE